MLECHLEVPKLSIDPADSISIGFCVYMVSDPKGLLRTTLKILDAAHVDLSVHTIDTISQSILIPAVARSSQQK